MAKFPACYYGPGDKRKIFHSADDVPEGWVDHPSKLPPAPAVSKAETAEPAPAAKTAPLTRSQIKAALMQRGIAIPRGASTEALYEQLVSAVEAGGEA